MATITAAQAEELYSDGEGQHGDTVDDWTLVGESHDHPTRQSRWHQRYWLIVRDADGATWGLGFGIGLTEYQENDFPWEGWAGKPGTRELELTRLYPHTITRVEYRTRPAENHARVAIVRPDDDHVVVEVDGAEVASANHDEHGWSGMDAVVATALAVAKAVGLEAGE